MKGEIWNAFIYLLKFKYTDDQNKRKLIKHIYKYKKEISEW